VSGKNDSRFNSRNPFAGAEPAYDRPNSAEHIRRAHQQEGVLSFVNAERRELSISAGNHCSDSRFLHFARQRSSTGCARNPRSRTNKTPALDYQFFFGRGEQYADRSLPILPGQTKKKTNDGIGQLTWPSKAIIGTTEHTLQISDTQVFGSKIVDETRVQ